MDSVQATKKYFVAIWIVLIVAIIGAVAGLTYKHRECARTKCPLGLRPEFVVTQYEQVCVCAPIGWE